MNKKFNVSIAIMVYVSRKTSSKSEGVLKTWYDPSCMLLVSSRTHYVKNSVSIDYNGDDYPFSVTAKAALGLKLLWDKFPNRSYYGICGDDTMVDIPRLLKKLYHMKISPEKPYLLGQTMSHTDYIFRKKNITRVFGGAPIILTREATHWHNKIIQKKPNLWKKSVLPHDLWIGNLFLKHNPLSKIIHIPGLYSQPPWFYRNYPNERQGGIVHNSLSFHYLNEKNMYWIWPLWRSKNKTCQI